MTGYLTEGTPFEELSSKGTGQFFNWLGQQAEYFTRLVIREMLPDAEIEEDASVADSGPGSEVDNLVTEGDKQMYLETKYSLPRSSGSQLTRLVNQVTNASGKGKTVLNVLVKPSQAQLDLVAKALGSAANDIKIVSGIQDLAETISDLFGE